MGYREPSIIEIRFKSPKSLTEFLRKFGLKNYGERTQTLYVDPVENRIGFDANFNEWIAEKYPELTNILLTFARSMKKGSEIREDKEILYLE